jgi:Calcineurin-like phosphoesterase
MNRASIIKILLVLFCFVFVSSCVLLSLVSGEEAHEVFSRTKVWRSEWQNSRLRSPGSSLFSRCTISDAVFFLTTDGGINVAAELGRSCPRDAFVVLQRAPAMLEEEGEEMHHTVESLAVPASSLARAMFGEVEWQSKSSVENLQVAHLTSEELLAAAQKNGESIDLSNPTVAYLRAQLVVMRTQEGKQDGHLEIAKTAPITLRAPLFGGQNAGHKSIRIALLSDSQSGAIIFRDLLGHIAQSGTIAEEEEGVAEGDSNGKHSSLRHGGKRGVTTAVFSWASYYWSRNGRGGAGDKAILRPEGPSRPLDLLIHGGDTVQSTTSSREAYMYLLSPISDLYSKWGPSGLGDDGLGYAVPVLLIRGNHDDYARHLAYTQDPHKWPTATSTTNQEATGVTWQPPPSYFELRFGQALRLIVTDTSDESNEQVEWLQKTVCEGVASAPSTTTTLAFTHVPPYTEYWEKEAWEKGESKWSDYTRKRLLPVLMASNVVDAVVSGHSHIYQRGAVSATATSEGSHKDIAPSPYQCPGTADTTRPSLILATVGGGGGALEADKASGGKVHDSGLFEVTAVAHHFVLLEADSKVGSFGWLARARDGRTIDRFSLQKPIGEEASQENDGKAKKRI